MNSGWWNWTDQGRYYREALAWTGGDLRPAEHWYLPLYSLLGAMWVPMFRAEPFWIPDAVCLTVSGILVTRLAARLAPDLRVAPLLGALGFLVADATFGVSDISAEFAVKSWVEPWTTTPTAPLLLGLLLAALRLAERPTPGRAAACGMLWGLVLMTRPTEATWSSLPAMLFCAVVLLRATLSIGARLRIAAAGVATALAFAVLTLVLHLVVYGWHWGSYFEQSLGTGFELRLLPLRWLWLVLDSRPMHERFVGLARVFPWVLPGFAGILASLFAGRGRRAPHALVGGAILVHWAIYLCYRDLHPEGLWRFSNYHYFKWTQGLLCFYAILLVVRLARPPHRVAALAAVGTVLLACCWRVELVTVPEALNAVRVTGPHELTVRDGLTSPDQLVLVPASGGDDDIYNGTRDLRQAGRSWAYNGFMKAWPMPGGLAVEPLRRLPAGEGRIELSDNVTVAANAQPRLARMVIVFGLPCAIAPTRAVCRPHL